MIPAKKLITGTEDKAEEVQPRKTETKGTRVQHVIKLLIIMLLTYAIIFM